MSVGTKFNKIKYGWQYKFEYTLHISMGLAKHQGEHLSWHVWNMAAKQATGNNM